MNASNQAEDDEPRAGVAGLTPVSEDDRGPDEKAPWERDITSNEGSNPPDAARDPLTGRPANPSEAQRVERDHELDRAEGGAARALIEDLVSRGVARERAEQLVETYGADPERLKAEAWIEENLPNPSETEK